MTIRKPPKFSDMDGAMAWLLDRANIERMHPSRVDADMLKLDRMFELARRLDSPHSAFKSVHVAGTKGKGSTCEMTGAMLEACGYGVGVYSSPHLVDIRERIRINRQPISTEDFVRVALSVGAAEVSIDEAHGECTFFELITAIAFQYFAEQAIDVAIVEVGLGGRLDSTNIIQPEVAAITSISRDHWQILGDSLEKIAAEKAGIFKPGVAALTAPQPDGVLNTLREAANKAGTTLEVLGADIDFSTRFEGGPGGKAGLKPGASPPHMRVGLSTKSNSFEHVRVPMKGEHQAVNCGLALAIIDKLSTRGFRTPEARIIKGLETAVLPGRMEILNTAPRTLLDGAHNADSMGCLMKAIGAEVEYDSLVVIFGCAADKDINGMLEKIANGADKVIFTRTAGSARAADPKELAKSFEERFERVCQTAETLSEAFVLANKGRARGDLICVTGSLHLVGEAKKLLGTRESRL